MIKLSTGKGTIAIDMPEIEENGISIELSDGSISIKYEPGEEKKTLRPENLNLSAPVKIRKPRKAKTIADVSKEAVPDEPASLESKEKSACDAKAEIDPETESALSSALAKFRSMGVNKANPVSELIVEGPLPDEEIILFGPDGIKNHTYGEVKGKAAFKDVLSQYRMMAKNSPDFHLPNVDAEMQRKKLM